MNDDELLRFAQEPDQGKRMSVIVEVAAEPVRLAPRATASSPREHRGVGASPDVGAARAARARQHLERISAQLSEWRLPETPTVLPAAHAIVVTVTPEQLRLLGAMPDVGSIRRNRKTSAHD